jgi:hypothetical protein
VTVADLGYDVSPDFLRPGECKWKSVGEHVLRKAGAMRFLR